MNYNLKEIETTDEYNIIKTTDIYYRYYGFIDMCLYC